MRAILKKKLTDTELLKEYRDNRNLLIQMTERYTRLWNRTDQQRIELEIRNITIFGIGDEKICELIKCMTN